MTSTACDDQLRSRCKVCGIDFARPRQADVPDGYCTRCWEDSEALMGAQDKLADAWDAGEKRIERIAQSDASGDHYAEDGDGESALSQALSMPSKYHVRLKGAWCDVYDVLKAFGVTNPADQHAIKKMLMPGKRGHKGGIQDRREAIQSLQRAIELEGEL